MMTLEKLHDEIKSVIQSVSPKVGINTISANTSMLRDIGLDSVQIIEFVVSLEDHFDYPLFDENLEVDLFDNFERLADFINNKLKTRVQ